VRTGTLPQTLSFVYNDDFDLTSFTYAGSTATFTYDDDGLITQAGAFTIARNATTGLPESVSDGAAVLVPSFNGYGEVSAQSVTVGGLPAMSWSVTRNDGGLITAKTETVGGTTDNYAYEYDTMGRLLEVEKGGIPVETYTYGANGQRLTETNTLRGITNRTYTYSLEDHLLSADAVTYAYDDDGFLTTKVAGLQTTSYQYSSRGELLEVDLPDNRVITYVHDPMGRRIAKKIDGVIVEKYLWAGMTQLLAVYNASNTLTMRFDGARMTRGGSTYYLVTDQVGTVRAVVDTAGSIVKRIDYDSFGNIITDTNPTFTIPFGFAGGLHDRDTGLIRFGARDYDPDTGRWTAKDPIGFAGGDTNLYGYCLANPINSVDLSGFMSGSDALDYTEQILGLAGLIPGVGAIPDAADALLNVARGDWDDALVSVGAMIPLVGGPVRLVDEGRSACKALALAKKLGNAGEEAAGITKNTCRVMQTGLEAAYRIPDSITATAIIEVKNVALQSMTSQLRDYMRIAEAQGKAFELYVRPTTRLSRSLQDAVESGQITLRYLP